MIILRDIRLTSGSADLDRLEGCVVLTVLGFASVVALTLSLMVYLTVSIQLAALAFSGL